MTVMSHCDVVLSVYFGEKNGFPEQNSPEHCSSYVPHHIPTYGRGLRDNHGPWAPESDVSKFMTMLLNKMEKKDENGAELST